MQIARDTKTIARRGYTEKTRYFSVFDTYMYSKVCSARPTYLQSVPNGSTYTIKYRKEKTKMDFNPARKRSTSVTSLHTDIEALSSSLEKFHYENESSRSVLAGASPVSRASSVVLSNIFVNDTESEMETSGDHVRMEDSGICDSRRADVELDLIVALEKKVDTLSGKWYTFYLVTYLKNNTPCRGRIL